MSAPAGQVPESLGVALRRWRDRLDPADAGLPARAARRARGLRREELAQLAGLSVDYVVRLEQGRARTPSTQVVTALARALQLDVPERDHLHRLAGLLPPQDGRISTHVPPGVQRMLTRLEELPVAVFTACWDLLTWNPLWAALLGDPGGEPPQRRNLVRAVFGDAGPGTGLAAWQVVQEDDGAAMRAALVADLRTACTAHPHDPDLAALVADLRRSSTRFAALWDTGAVGVHTSARKVVLHPSLGPVDVDCDVLTVAGSDLRLVVYSAAAASPAARALELLRVTGPVPLASG